jgi:hypothetical protein
MRMSAINLNKPGASASKRRHRWHHIDIVRGRCRNSTSFLAMEHPAFML